MVSLRGGGHFRIDPAPLAGEPDGMPDPSLDPPLALWLALAGLGGLLLLVLVGLIRLRARLVRVERRLVSMATASGGNPAESGDPEPSVEALKEANREQKRWFGEFLEEDPSRRELSKKEQFAAFRKWRSERGLNWSGEAGPGGGSGVAPSPEQKVQDS